MNDRDQEDQAWRDALHPLREVETPAGLEARVLAAVAQPAVRWRVRWLAAAALLLVLGGVAGRWLATRGQADPRPRYLLLLFEGPGFDSTSATHQARVDEYRAWAGTLARTGQLVEAGELAPSEDRLGALPEPVGAQGHVIAGFFVVRAADQAAARALAATCPHLAHGGGVMVRPLTGS